VENKLGFAHVCNILGLSGYTSLEKLYGFLMQKDTKPALDEIHNLYTEGFDLTQFNKSFLEFLRKKMIASVAASGRAIDAATGHANVKAEQKTGETAWIVQVINNFQQAYDQARFATIPQLPLEIAVINSCIPVALAATPTIPAALPTESARADVRTHNSIKSQDGSDKPLNEANFVHVNKPQTDNIDQNSQPTSKVEAAEKKSLDAADVRQKWPRILEHLNIPLVKRLFQETALSGVSGNVVTLACANNFNMDKIMETANRVALEHAFSQVLSVEVKIVCTLKRLIAEGMSASKVAEMFEGEVV
jgi:DNA polymerase III gamma/tau subunit